MTEAKDKKTAEPTDAEKVAAREAAAEQAATSGQPPKYDYARAANPGAAAPIRPSQQLQTVPISIEIPQANTMKNGGIRPGSDADENDYAPLVRARYRGHYHHIHEPGDTFDNTKNLPTYPEDPNSWFEDATRDPDWEHKLPDEELTPSGRRRRRG